MTGESDDRRPSPPNDTSRNSDEQNAPRDGRAGKSPTRKLRYDAPKLEIPRPLHLRSSDPDSDEEAA